MLVIKQFKEEYVDPFWNLGFCKHKACEFCLANKRACIVKMYPRAKQIKFIDLILFTLYFNLFLLR